MRIIRKIKLPKDFSKFAFLLIAVIALNVSVLTPLFENRAEAASGPASRINFPQRKTYNRGDNTALVVQTCEAYFDEEVLTQGLRDTHMPGADFNTERVFNGEYLGRTVPVIKFRVATSNQPAPVNGQRSDRGNDAKTICESVMLLPSGTTQWTGSMFTVNAGSRASDKTSPKIRANIASGDVNNNNDDFTAVTLSYYNATGDCSIVNNTNFPTRVGSVTTNQDCFDESSNFKIGGRPTNLEDSQVVGTNQGFTARWVDAATIERSLVSGSAGAGIPAYATKETYKLNRWQVFDSFNNSLSPAREVGYTVYLLDSSDDSARNAVRQETGRSCTNPAGELDDNIHPTFSDCSPPTGDRQCTPFIVVTEQLNIDTNNGQPNIDGPSENFSDRVGKMDSANAYFYNFDPDDCRYLGRSSGKTLGRTERANAWFYYSAEADAVTTVFPTGAGNESHFIGSYAEIDRQVNQGDPANNPTITFRGGQNGCNADARVSGSSNLRNTTWTFYGYSPNCGALGNGVGSVQVKTIAGQEGEDGFAFVTGYTPPLEVDETGSLQELSCVSGPSFLDWILCPVLNLAIAGSEGLDTIINSILDVDTNQIFGTEETSDAYHTAWGVFRTFALILIAAAALIMVIAQAAGLELLDAYTIRKILPRLIIASIAITLSWELMEFLVTLSNDLGNGIRSIIYAPFEGFDFRVGLAGFVAQLALVGGAVVLGLTAFPVVLSLFLAGVLAALIAVGLLVFREVLIIFLVIIAPVAIACAILPNTEKAWSLWRTTFISMLVVFLIISAIIAMGRVFAVTSAGAGVLLTDIVAIIAWFAPYFLIPFAFRLAGGVVGRLTGVINDSSRGVFDRLRKQRHQAMSNRFQALREGRTGTFNPVARGVGGLLRRATPGSGGFVPTAGGRARYADAQRGMYIQAAEESIKHDNGRAAYDDDANFIASEATSRRDFLDNYQSEYGATEEQARQAMGRLEAGYGVDVGSKQARIASAMALSRSPTSFKKMNKKTGKLEAMTTEETLAKAADINAGLINDGIMNDQDAAAMWKKNSARPDISKISHGNWAKMASDAAAAKAQNPALHGADLLTGKHMQDAKDSIIENVDPSIVSARPEAVENWSRIMQDRVTANKKSMAEAAANNDTAGYQKAETNYIQDLARIKSMHETFSRANSSNTGYVANLFDNASYDTAKGTTLFDEMENSATKQDPRFTRMRHEWSVRDAAAGRTEGPEPPGQ